MKSMKLKSGEHFWYLTARFSSNRQVKLSASKIILFFHTFLFLLQRAWLFKNYHCEFKSNLKSGEHKFTALLYLKHNISIFCMCISFRWKKMHLLPKCFHHRLEETKEFLLKLISLEKYQYVHCTYSYNSWTGISKTLPTLTCTANCKRSST